MLHFLTSCFHSKLKAIETSGVSGGVKLQGANEKMQYQLKSLFQKEAFHRALVLLGAAFTLVIIILGWGGIEHGTNFAIRKIMRLKPGSRLWDTWKTIPIPVYLKFHFFNISTNPGDIASGSTPEMKEVGPYVYLIDFDKFDFQHNPELDTVTYSPSKTFFFQPHLSKGQESDLITYVNIIYVAVSHMAHDITQSEFILETLDEMLRDGGEELTRTDRVRDLIFDGVSIETYVDLVDNPLVKGAGNITIPEKFADGLFALFKGKNGTKDGRWECHKGMRNNSELGKLRSYNGNTKLDNYNGDSCNAINGSEGSLNPPFIQPGITDLHIFIPELCRSIKWEFVEMSKVGRIPVAKHTFPDIQTPSENPDLSCFCPKKDAAECNIHGVSSLAGCFGGAPLLYTKPHFLGADESLKQMVSGVRPNPKLHQSELNVHPLTGATISASIKMQFSIELVPWPEMPGFQNASRAIIPLVWIEVAAKLEGTNLRLIGLLSTLLKWYPIFRWPALVGGSVVVALGAVLIHLSRLQVKSEVVESEDED